MSKFNNRYIFIFIAVLFSAFLCVAHVSIMRNTENLFSSCKDTSNMVFYKTNQLIEKYFGGAEKEADNTKPVQNNQKEGNNISRILSIVLGSSIILNEKAVLTCITVLFIAAAVLFKRNRVYYHKPDIPPDIKFYLRWRLKFLTPIQKYLKNLIHNYDIEPVYTTGAYVLTHERNPHFVKRLSECGFFYCINCNGYTLKGYL